MDVFISKLDRLTQTGSTFGLSSLLVLLTFDVIGAVAMNENLDAQRLDSSQTDFMNITSNKNRNFVKTFLDLIKTYQTANEELPRWMTPLADLKRQRMAAQLDVHLTGIIRKRFAEMEDQDGSSLDKLGNKNNDILSLALRSLNTRVLTRAAEKQACDQLKTFLFAGHDTTSVFLSWLIYELWRTPRALAAVRTELDAVFGGESPDEDHHDTMREMILSVQGHEKLGRLVYLGAVIKETLRLYPPAGAPRIAKKGSNLTLHTTTGEEYVVDEAVLYVNHHIIHRDVTVYGQDADCFMPERWLGPDGKEAGADIPPGAWRPFERGPMDCIGQGLANLEARIVIAMVARRFDFSKVGLGELWQDDEGRAEVLATGQYKLRSDLHNVSPAMLRYSIMTDHDRYAWCCQSLLMG